jgi:hypothetical protein
LRACFGSAHAAGEFGLGFGGQPYRGEFAQQRNLGLAQPGNPFGPARNALGDIVLFAPDILERLVKGR